MILEEGHIENDTIKYAKPLKIDFYRDLVIRIGYVMHSLHDKMSIENMGNLKLAQATICQLGLEEELNIQKKILNKMEENK